jgi:hypothetical protein
MVVLNTVPARDAAVGRSTKGGDAPDRERPPMFALRAIALLVEALAATRLPSDLPADMDSAAGTRR